MKETHRRGWHSRGKLEQTSIEFPEKKKKIEATRKECEKFAERMLLLLLRVDANEGE